MIWPSFASRSTVSLFQKERRVPVSFSFPMVWRAPLSEKKLVSPEKKAPFTGSGSSVSVASMVAATGDSKSLVVEAGCGAAKLDEEETGALHQASLVAPAAVAIPAVSAASEGVGEVMAGSAGAGEGNAASVDTGETISPGSGQVGSFETTGSGDGCDQTGSPQAGASFAAAAGWSQID